MNRVLVSWSSGKDSAWALLQSRREGYEVAGLLTTVTEAYGRVSMHGVRVELLVRQAEQTGLPLRKVEIPLGCSNAIYEEAFLGELARAREEDGVEHVVFGDLFLEDIRAYREALLARAGLTPVFPLWGRETAVLAREMLQEGLRAVIVCTDPSKVPDSFAGREYDSALLEELPRGVDPCGERGEFHTFAHAGPMFRNGVPVRRGETVRRDGFVFADLLPEAASFDRPRSSSSRRCLRRRS